MSKQPESRASITVKNFDLALKTLKRFLSTPIVDDRDRAGIIQAFEFCYELAWQSLKKIAEEQGLEAPTPLQAFQAGFQMGLIQENENTLWLEMKKTRNLTSHTYREELSIQVLSDIVNTYAPAFDALADKMRSKTQGKKSKD